MILLCVCRHREVHNVACGLRKPEQLEDECAHTFFMAIFVFEGLY